MNNTTKEDKQREKYEYETQIVRIYKNKLDDSNLKSMLNEMGLKGWELVSVQSDSQDAMCIFKREFV
jgi:arsenate reductase-like glutaredoxin family protein